MDISYFLQNIFIMNFKTGNIIIDSIISLFLLYIIQFIIKNIQSFNSILKLFYWENNYSEYIIQGKIISSMEYTTEYVIFPNEYKSIIYKLYKLNINIKSGKKINKNDKYIKNKFDKFSYFINNNKKIFINKDIWIQQNSIINNTNDFKSSNQTYNLSICSKKYSFNQLKDIIDKWTFEYNNFVKEFNDGKKYYFSYLGNKKLLNNNDKNTNFLFDIHEFNSNKSFNNIFFEQKELLINRLNYFINNKNEYERLGIPYTFGLLFSGDPGCGKTSTIKAIANSFKKNIVEISLSKIKTCSELKHIFFNDIINEKYIPDNKKIIVLEDIDCMGDIIKKRETKKIITSTEKNNNSEKNNYEEENDLLTLSYILNLIDGVLEQNGRILIITTNYPKKLDPALIRPGRIDLKINFKKCSKKIINNILSFYFKKNINFDFEDYKYTPAEIFEYCFNNNNINSIVNQINKK